MLVMHVRFVVRFVLRPFYEPFSSLSHLLGALVFSVLGWRLVRRGRRTPGGAGFRRTAALVVFVITTVLLLGVSGVFHMARPGARWREVFGVLDHAAIFALIAGTFTPVHVIFFRGFWRWGVLLFIWTAAATGVSLTGVFGTQIPHWLIMTIYLAMGWTGVLSMISLARRRGHKPILPLILGGGAYTLGALIDFWNGLWLVEGVLGPHELFHLCVLLGLSLHWQYVWSIADAAPAKERRNMPWREGLEESDFGK